VLKNHKKDGVLSGEAIARRAGRIGEKQTKLKLELQQGEPPRKRGAAYHQGPYSAFILRKEHTLSD
jgi:hypothetical protein